LTCESTDADEADKRKAEDHEHPEFVVRPLLALGLVVLAFQLGPGHAAFAAMLKHPKRWPVQGVVNARVAVAEASERQHWRYGPARVAVLSHGSTSSVLPQHS
jgi:hypothetical protein